MKHTKILLIIALIAGILMISGCSERGFMKSSKEEYTDGSGKSRMVSKEVENDLLSKINSGNLVAIHNTEMDNSDTTNYMIIKNAYSKVQDFKIEPCDGCTIINELKIEADDYFAFGFDATGVGLKKITVTDSLGNYYGGTQFTVTN